jgi:hypothetical protein
MRYLLALMLISTIIATTSTAYGQEYTATPVADTHVREDLPATNYGLAAAMFARTNSGTNSIVLLAFAPPNAADIVTATMWIYSYNNSATPTDLYETHSGWGETSTTWNNRPQLGGYIDTLAVVDGWNSADVSGAIRTGRGIALIPVATSSALRYWRSRQSSLSPYIVYEYAPTPTPSVTATPAPTPTPAPATTRLDLPSGGLAEVTAVVSFGEAMVAGLLVFLIGTVLFALAYAASRKAIV